MNNDDDIRLAVLIDADNISSHYVKALMEEVARYGIPTIKRIYGDWTRPNLSNWKNCLLDHAIAPIQQFGYTSGKNSTDSALIIDAMDILYAEKVDGFCLVSSDSDFTRLATRLREAGKVVYGFGEQKTPNPFIAACDRFVFLEIIHGVDKSLTRLAQPSSSNSCSQPINYQTHDYKIDQDLSNLVYSSINDVADEDGWAFLGDVGNMIIKKRPSFDPRAYGCNKLSALIRKFDRIEFDERPTNSPRIMHIYIRLKDN